MLYKNIKGMEYGKSMHEDPGVPNYGRKGIGPRLQKGMTLAVEPMVVEGSAEILDNDKDRMDCCNFRWKNVSTL